MSMLEITEIDVGYGQTQVLFDVSMSVDEGEVVALIGANGAGKTTTMRSIAGLTPPWNGQISFKDDRIDGNDPEEIVEAGLVLCPERRALFPKMTVVDNLRVGASLVDDDSEVESRMEEVYEWFPRLKERSNQAARNLSGGEGQMLAIGKSMMADPDLLLLDEPSLGLAPQLVEDIMEIIEQLNAERSLTTLLVEQNANKALEIADRGYVLQTGEITLEGESEQLRNDEQVREAYLGL